MEHVVLCGTQSVQLSFFEDFGLGFCRYLALYLALVEQYRTLGLDLHGFPPPACLLHWHCSKSICGISSGHCHCRPIAFCPQLAFQALHFRSGGMYTANVRGPLYNSVFSLLVEGDWETWRLAKLFWTVSRRRCWFRWLGGIFDVGCWLPMSRVGNRIEVMTVHVYPFLVNGHLVPAADHPPSVEAHRFLTNRSRWTCCKYWDGQWTLRKVPKLAKTKDLRVRHQAHELGFHGHSPIAFCLPEYFLEVFFDRSWDP